MHALSVELLSFYNGRLAPDLSAFIAVQLSIAVVSLLCDTHLLF